MAREIFPLVTTASFDPSVFVGREDEQTSLERALILGEAKVGSIVGFFGTGKTSLAMMFANRFKARCPGGTCHYNLSELRFDSRRLTLSDALREKWPERREVSLFIIEEIDSNSDAVNEAELTRITDLFPDCRILLTSTKPISWPFVGVTVQLGPLSENDMRDLIYRRLGRDLQPWQINQLYAALKGNLLSATLAVDTLRTRLFTLNELMEALQPFEHFGIVGPDGQPLGDDSSAYRRLVADVSNVSGSLLRHLSTDPTMWYRLTPRQFEEVVADLLGKQGYTVSLTPASRDGGKDIYAASKTSLGSFLYLVECKRYTPDHPVGVGIIRQLYGVVQAERATAGIVATTSFFTPDAKEFQNQIDHQMSLQDYFGIQKWLQEARKSGSGKC